jgi:hypothetical protein
MSTGERHGDVRHVCALCIRDGRLSSLDRCMTTHLLSFVFAAYEAFEDSGVNEKSRFDIAGLVESAPVYL